jgi:hypothetical protein
MEPDCWYLNFHHDIPESDYEQVCSETVKMAPAGCYLIDISEKSHAYVLISMGGGKSAAHMKRRAADQNPEQDWAKHSRFIVADSPVLGQEGETH